MKDISITWCIGLILTLYMLVLCNLVWNGLSKVEERLDRLEKSTPVVGFSTDKLNDMHRKVTSMERFLRTTPLVECGNK